MVFEGGARGAAGLALNIALSLALLIWLRARGLWARYGLCKPRLSARRLLWYLPLAVGCTYNLWFGASLNLPLVGAAIYAGNMLCVGLLEEVIFRGMLFRALARDGLRSACVVSSVSFGLGHLLNIFVGGGMALADNLTQVVGAIVFGYLFVMLFTRSGSLLPCIAAHQLNNLLSVFANEAASSWPWRRAIFALNLALLLAYALFLRRRLPPVLRGGAEEEEE